MNYLITFTEGEPKTTIIKNVVEIGYEYQTIYLYTSDGEEYSFGHNVIEKMERIKE